MEPHLLAGASGNHNAEPHGSKGCEQEQAQQTESEPPEVAIKQLVLLFLEFDKLLQLVIHR
jgi:hypothetical protein